METPRPAPAPTRDQFAAYQGMFDFFNGELFNGRLPAVVLNFSRKAKTNGFFAPERWAAAHATGDVRHEISINPETLTARTPAEVASTLVHEMVHLEQATFGRPSRANYHNAEWAAWMDRVGLRPTSDGTPEGKRVGQRVTHLIVPGGPFAEAFKRMPPALLLPFHCAPEPAAAAKAAKKNKVAYECRGGCGAKAWGKPGLNMSCNDCDDRFVSESDAGDDDAQ